MSRQEPGQRWQSAADLGDELTSLKSHPRPESAGVAIRSSLFRRIAVPAAALAIAVAATWAWLPRTDRTAADAPIAFVIPPPDGVRWNNLPPEPWPAVSPDGKRLAFVGRSDGGLRVWVRELEDATPRLLAGSPDFAGLRMGLFWSSDSARLGYCVKNLLRLHAFHGGPPVVLDAGCTSGVASWNGAGDILFRGENGIFKISERGGPATRVTSDGSSREGTHNFPRWLPDGRRFVFTIVGPDPDAAGIFVGTLDGRSRTRIVADVSKSEYVASANGTAYLLFVRQGQPVLQRVDPPTLTPVGDARVLADRMGIGNIALPSFSASPTLLVHRSGGNNPRSAWLWVDRQGRPTDRRDGERVDARWAALSPDDSVLIYTRQNPDGSNGGLWMNDYARGIQRELLGSQSVFLPAFSRNGRRIAFAAVSVRGRQLFITDFPSGKPTQVATSTTLGLMSPDWSADDTTLIGTDNFGRIVAVTLDAPGEAEILVDNASQGRLSPDGRWLAFTSAMSGEPEVYVQRFPGGDDRKRVSAQGGVQPRWRGDGSELFYLAPDGMLMAIKTSQQFQGAEPARLFRGQFSSEGANAFDQTYLPTHDGQRFLIGVPAEGPVPLTALRNWLMRAAPTPD